MINGDSMTRDLNQNRLTHAHNEVSSSYTLAGFRTTADGLWVGVEESCYWSRLAKASLIKMPQRSNNNSKNKEEY